MSDPIKTQKSANRQAIPVKPEILTMRPSRKREWSLGRALVAGAVLTVASQAGAVPITSSTPVITYVWTGEASGKLNGQSFSDATFTITAEAYPSQITSPVANVFSVPDFLSTIAIAGIGTATFTDQMITELLQNNTGMAQPAIGFADLTKGVAVIVESNPAFEAYNLGYSESSTPATSIQYSPNSTFATSKGNLSLTSFSDSTFSANLAVPDAASTLGLLSLSATTLLLVSRKYGFNQAA
jgi:hypothetical protein